VQVRNAFGTQLICGRQGPKTMNGKVIIYIGSALPLIWGIAHLFPTKSVVRGFGDISNDNKSIITMEWLIEGIALIFIGILVATITLINPKNIISTTIYLMSSACLLILAIISLFTGFRINFMPFRMCPIIFTSSAILITIGWAFL
jgi:hypothetical protein